MDTALVNAAVGIQQANLGNQIQFAVARKVIDAQNADGAAALQLLNAASKGTQAGDAMTAAATGLGGQLDVMA